MTNVIRMGIRATVLAVALLGMFAANHAAAKPAEADRVLDRWVKAIGGQARLKAMRDSEYSLRYLFPNGMIMRITAQIQPGGLFRLTTHWPNGEHVIAYDGQVAWQQHAHGRGLFPRAKAEEMRRTGDPQFPLRVKNHFAIRRRLPDETRDGKTLEVLELETAAGEREKWFFNPTTHLLVRVERKEDGVDLVLEFSDFRKVDGLIEPFRTTARGTGGAWDAEIAAVDRTQRIDPALLSPPEGLVADAGQVEAVLARYIAAAGGLEAEAKVNSRVTRTAVEVATAGMNFVSVVSQRAPDRVLIEQDVPGMGRVTQGFDGQTGWAWSELQGYRELQGLELAQIAGMAPLQTLAKIQEQFPLHNYLGERTVDGRTLLAVEFAAVAASGGVHYFDPETGHLMRVESVVAAGNTGMMQVVMEMSDFRAVDGVIMPFRNVVTNPAVRIINRVESVTHNVELPDRLFVPRKDGEPPPAE